MIKLANASTGRSAEANQVKLCDFYGEWTHIIRPYQKYVNGLSFFAEKLCENNNVLYSQEKRLTLNNLLKKNGYNIRCVNEKCYVDCSSFVGTCLNGVGVLVDVSSFTTRTMIDICKRLGFEIIKFDKSKIMKGDILLKDGSHTVIVVEATTEKNLATGKGRVKINDINSYLNVREKPSTSSKVITTLQYNDEVDIIGETDNWYKVRIGNLDGYCSKQYIKCNEIQY